jgi:flavin-dependent dehydrogenase
MSRAEQDGLPLYDALIVGAGPAGSTLARQLARGGWRVALVEREPKGRDRVCGGFLGPEVSQLWQELDLGRHRASLPAAPVRSLTLSGTGSARIEIPLPDGGGLGVSRAEFDRWLSDRAVEAGAHLCGDTKVRRVRPTAQMARVTLERGGALQEVAARVVIRAAGRRRAAAGTVRHAEGYFGCKTVYEQVAGSGGGVALHFIAQGHVGFNSLPDGRTTMCLYVAQSRIRAARGRLDDMMTRFSEDNPAIGRALHGARRAGPWMSCPAQPDAHEVFVQHGAFNVGDAVTMVNPVLGAGLSVAMGSSVLLARELLAGRRRDVDAHQVARRYAQAWRAQFAARARLGRWLGWCEERPAVSEQVLRLLSAHPAWCARVVRYARPATKRRAAVQAGWAGRPQPAAPCETATGSVTWTR